MEGTLVEAGSPLLWRIPSHGPQESLNMVEDPQDFGPPAGALGFWEDASAIATGTRAGPPPWAATSLRVQCKGEAKDPWGEG